MTPSVLERNAAESSRLAALARETARRQRTKQEIYDGDEELRHIVIREVDRRKLSLDIAPVVVSGEIETTIEGASTVTLDIHDPRWVLWRSGVLDRSWDILVDRRPFRLVGRRRSGKNVSLVFESRLVSILRGYRRPRAATRNDDFTRAMFFKAMLDEVKEHDVYFVCPELRVRQATERPRLGGRSREERDEQREPGFAPGAAITVKGSRASALQRRVLDETCAEAFRLGSTAEVMVACVMCITQESAAGLPEYTHSTALAAGETHRGPYQQQPGYGTDAQIQDPTTSTNAFLLGRNGIPGWRQRNGPLGGAAPRDLGAAIERVQISGLGHLYNQHRDEAEATVRMWLGGARAGRRSASATRVKPYQFHRGRPDGPRGEDTWACTGRLADEVGWRRFVVDDASGGAFYFISEEDLMGSRPVMSITAESDGIDGIDCDVDDGKTADTVTIACRMDRWEAQAGQVIEITDYGPATGTFLVSSIRRPLFSTAGTIEARRGRALLQERREPAPETETVSISGSRSGGKGSAGAEEMVRWARSTLGVTEGSARHRRWADDVGVFDPWCSVWVAYGLKHVAGLSWPANPAYSGAWLEWSDGRRVSVSDLTPGDLVIYDWGDGGITDHIAMYIGGEQVIGGNQSDAVTEAGLKRSFIVGVVRPNYKD